MQKKAIAADGKAHRTGRMPAETGAGAPGGHHSQPPAPFTCLGSDATPEVGVEGAGLEHRCHQGLVFCYQQVQNLRVGQ